MNTSMVRYILGCVLKLEAALLLLPCLVAVIYCEKEGWCYLAAAFACVLTGFLMTIKKPKERVFYLKEGCIATALSWVFLSFFGALPFIFTGEIPKIEDALFETISGFTTTGASVLADVESLSHASIMWRSFTHWIGGMGVLVFLMAVIPLSGASNFNLMRAESPGPSVEKLVPKIKYSARLLYVIYFGMTILQMILLILGKMPIFDAVATAFGTAGTGGFGIKNDSMAGYSPYIQWVIAIFMILFGVNFNAYYFLVFRHFKKAFSMEEVRYYFLVIFVAVVIIVSQILPNTAGIFEALRLSVFQVGSIITTTGFSTVDFDLWSEPCRVVLVMLMFCGACAGSTGGGIKVSRFVIMIKTVFKEITSYMHPKSIKKIKIEGKPVEHDVVRATNVYIITFIILFAISVFIVSFEGKGLVTTFTAVTATINNIGPGLEGVGPTQNFGGFNAISKYVMMFDMLAGRLELFPLLIMLNPIVWKEAVSQHFRKKRKN